MMSKNKIQRAIDIVESMSDISADSIEKIAGEISTPESVDEAYYYLEAKKKVGHAVRLESMHCVILACALLGDEQRAMETLAALPSLGLKPTARTFHYMVRACGFARNRARNTEIIIETMAQHDVVVTETLLDDSC